MRKRPAPRAEPDPALEILVPVLPARDAVHFPGLVSTLHVAREASLRAARQAKDGDRRVLVLSQRDMSLDEPQAADLCEVGSLSEVLQALPMPDASMRLALRGVSRAKVLRLTRRRGAFYAVVEELGEVRASGPETEALMRECLAAFSSIVQLGKQVPPETMPSLLSIEEGGALADAILHHLPVRTSIKQQFLEELDSTQRLRKTLALLRDELQVLELRQKIQQRVDLEVGDAQREYYLREQLRIIQQELNGPEGRELEYEELRGRIESSGMSEQARAKALIELRRLERLPDTAPEVGVSRGYLDWLLSLPWAVSSSDRLNLLDATRLLDAAHHGLAPVKERVLDFLAVRQLNPSLRGPILCFVGPPGVGKTSIGRSIAEALGRRFVRVSLGGVKDEAEIRGHRRTYVGAMPGRLIQGLRQCGTRNPVFMLDEIDKIASDYRGDATSALLEALDPEQNSQFSDHYIEAPFDLGEVMFIATANTMDTIPPALRDRMEMITFPSYTDEERQHIAREFLLPRRAAANGLRPGQIAVSPDALHLMVRDYTKEAGVRNLERVVDTVCRKVARRVAEGDVESFEVDPSSLALLLGPSRRPRPKALQRDELGTANGLVVTEYGGEVITIEASLMEPNGEMPQILLTGSLGDVMKESAQAAVTFIRANQSGLSSSRRFRYDVHVHVPEGAMPKDGPSAGITIAVALASAFSGAPVRSDLAMTGEITLRGNVLPVGGIREKVLAARRAGIRHLVLPADNEGDLADVPNEVRNEMVFHLVRHVQQVLDLALVWTEQALIEVRVDEALGTA